MQEQPRQFAFFARGTASVIGQIVLHRFDHSGGLIVVAVTENVGSKPGVIINVFIAIDVPETRALGPGESDDWIGFAIERGETARDEF